MDIAVIVGGIISVLGSLFLLLGALGLVRMPDLFNRIQAGTKATTLGTMLFLTGIGVAQPSWIPRLFLLVIFIIFTNPVSSHVLARSAHYVGESMSAKTVTDQLAGSQRDSAGDLQAEGGQR